MATSMYTAVVYNQLLPGQLSVQPAMPSTITGFSLYPPNWDLTSSNVSQRTAYVGDTQGALTYADAMLAIYGLAQLKLMQISSIQSACDASIQTGFPAMIYGINTLVTLKQGGTSHDQTNALSSAVIAQNAVGTAVPWAPSMQVSPSTIVKSGGLYYTSMAASGIAGSTPPAFPSEMSVGVVDGTVTWYQLGFRISTSNGFMIVDAPTIIALFMQGWLFVNEQRAKYQTLVDSINAATSPSAVLATTW